MKTLKYHSKEYYAARPAILSANEVARIKSGKQAEILLMDSELKSFNKMISKYPDSKCSISYDKAGNFYTEHFSDESSEESSTEKEAAYKIGNVLYVKEPFYDVSELLVTDKNGSTIISKSTFIGSNGLEIKPAGDMTKEMAVNFLEITGIQIRRIQSLTFRDGKKLGLYNSKKTDSDATYFKKAIKRFWNGKIKPTKKGLNNFGYEANPFVYVLKIEPVQLVKDERKNKIENNSIESNNSKVSNI